MEEGVEVLEYSINVLPVEVISIILQHIDCKSIISFASTCKRFLDMVMNNQLLWKGKFKHILPGYVFEVVDKNVIGQWLQEIKEFFELKRQLYSELMLMSAKYYWYSNAITLEDVRHFFDIALSSNMNYFYVIFILQDFVRKASAYIEGKVSSKPYTLTEMHYAKVVLRHLIQTFLSVKWVKSHMKKELPPEVVVNFFLQWIDTANVHPDHEIDIKIKALVVKVQALLDSQQPKYSHISIADRRAANLVSEKHILSAITEVIYHQKHMAVTTSANLETLNILKALQHRCANVIVVAALYHSMARHCGVKCELVAFPNHLFLEWRDRSEPRNPVVYSVDLGTGELKPKRRCPYSRVNLTSSYKYCPDSLLQYIYSSYHLTMGSIKDWYTKNAFHLLDFLGTSHTQLNPYRNFLPYLIDHTHLPAMNIPLDLTFLNEAHARIIRSLANLNVRAPPHPKEQLLRRRNGSVKYAVGMVCYHRQFEYVGVIHAWDLTGISRADPGPDPEPSRNQPHYHFMASDKTNRYVAQEFISEITRPRRLYHLEDTIAREFTHFDGFAYVPNDEKRSEYPDDEFVVGVYRNLSQC